MRCGSGGRNLPIYFYTIFLKNHERRILVAIRSARIGRGTTPVLDLTLDAQEVQDATVYITIDQGDVQLTKSNYHDNPEIEINPIYDEETWEQIATEILVYYSQEETLRLRAGHGKIQVKWVFDDGTADESVLGRIEVFDSLLNGVISHG